MKKVDGKSITGCYERNQYLPLDYIKNSLFFREQSVTVYYYYSYAMVLTDKLTNQKK